MSFHDRSWMYVDKRARSGRQFCAGIDSFLAFALPNAQAGTIACPCSVCENLKWRGFNKVAEHLHKKGFMPGYEVWYFHGEEFPNTNEPPQHDAHDFNNDPFNENRMQQMILDSMGEQGQHFNAGEGSSSGGQRSYNVPDEATQRFLDLLRHTNRPLRAGGQKTVLQHVAQLLHAKVRNKLSITGFDDFLALELQAMNPADAANMPKNWYELQKMLKPLRLPYHEIHVCVNDCFLYYGEQASELSHCPYCGESRYEVNRNRSGSQTIPRKKIWYFPIADRLKRLFLCPKTAEAMTWHARNRTEQDEMNHPSCGEAWKHFDRTWPEFASEWRNARVGFCTDGFTPSHSFGQHSIWPVFMAVYNLPPELCMTGPYMFITMIISGPRSPGRNLDVMLQPVIQELNHLWRVGVDTWDAHRKEMFTLHVVLMWTVSDFPAYGMFSCWMTHGKLSCPYCQETTVATRLVNGKKQTWFDCHRKFLPLGHPFRQNSTHFTKNKICGGDQIGLERRTGFEVATKLLQDVPDYVKVFPGKNRRGNPPGYGSKHNWYQRSIFWNLPYWSTHLVRHNLDVMHVEKNVFENIFFTVIDDPRKSKDNLNARKDLQLLTNRETLFPLRTPDGDYVPQKAKAAYTVNLDQKKLIFEWVKTLKFPDGYASNLGTPFNSTTLKVSTLKSHECHVFLQRLMPIAFGDFLPANIMEPLNELAMFFRKLCAPTIRASEMEVLKLKIVEIICKLEMIFPPSFFDSMEHLMVHLPYEAKVCGPVHYRWMYPFERRMSILKDYVKNPALPEACIAKAYLNSEVSNFCTMYFGDDQQHALNTLSRNQVPTSMYNDDVLDVFRLQGRSLGRGVKVNLTAREENAAHLYVLLNCADVQPFLSMFDDQFCQGLEGLPLNNARSQGFPDWFREQIINGHYPPQLCHLAERPSSNETVTYKGYIANGFRFHIENHGRSGPINSGVCARGISNEDADLGNYYGRLQNIIRLHYHGGFYVVLFLCKWYDSENLTRGIKVVPEHGIVEINPNRFLQRYDPFILASQATQVTYTKSAGNHTRTIARKKGWETVISTRARHLVGTVSNAQSDIVETTTADVEFQDNYAPTFNYSYNGTNDPIQLFTGILEPVLENEDENDHEGEEEDEARYFDSNYDSAEDAGY